MALLTTDEVEHRTLGRVPADLPGLSQVLSRAEESVIAYCEWHVAPRRTETLILDGTGSRLLQLPSLKVNDVTTVRHLGETMDPDLYDWSATGQIELRNPQARWTDRYRGIEVEIDHGYEDIPSDLASVIVGLVVRAAASPMGETMIRVGDRQSHYSRVGTMPLNAEYQVLERYRVRVA